MRDDPEKLAELGELLGALRDGTIADERMELLDQLLATDADAREYYLEYMDLCATLGHFQGTLANGRRKPTGALSTSRLTPAVRQPSGTRRRFLALAAAAAILLGLGLGVFFLTRPNGWTPGDQSGKEKAAAEAVAVLTRAVQPEWEGDAPVIGSKIRAGERLRLRSGIAQLEFFSGAVVVVEGPADFEPMGVGRVSCREGRIRARVSPPAEGFVIDSPAVKLVDRGTEFGFHIDRAGAAEVHVFHGKVELRNIADNSLRADAPQLTMGNGVSIDSNGIFHKIAADPDAFVSAVKLEQQWREELRRRYDRWLAHAQKIRADSRLLLYYTFQDQQPGERILRNQALAQKGALNGAIVGCAWSEGRWPSKGALDFKRPSDRVRFHLPGEYPSLTFLAWVRVDAFEQQISALMLTDGYDGRAAHWQLHQGKLLLGIKEPNGRGHNFYSQPCLGPDQLGEWFQLATVYNHRSRTVTHYVDGRPIPTTHYTYVGDRPVKREGANFTFPIRIGNVEIGNWGRAVPAMPSWAVARNFNGRIDEFALFREALSAEEIARWYEIGKPYP